MSTERLTLDAATLDDLDPMFALHADRDVWTHLPSGRHRDRAQTATLIAQCERDWVEHGLGYWTARLDGRVIGIGGCAQKLDVAYNVYYRLTPDAWGQGFATEITAAAIEVAVTLKPELPVTATLLEHNVSSRRTAERAGLTLAWRGPDAGNPDPAAVRLIYADRSLSSETVKALTGQ